MKHNDLSRRDFAMSITTGTAALAAQPLFGSQKSGSKIKLGLYSITYLGVWYRGDALTLEQVIERAKQFGYDGVEIDGKRPHGNPLDMSKSRCKELRKYASDQGIEIYAVAANNDFSSPMPEFREAQLVYTRELIRMTSDLNAKLLRVFLAWPGVTLRPEGGARYDLAKSVWEVTHKDIPPEQTWAWCRDTLREAARFAADAGVTLALQNHAPVIRSYKDVLKMVREIESPNLKVCFDTRLEHGIKGEALRQMTREIGPLQVLSHYGDEYEEAGGRIVPKEDEFLADQVAGLQDIGYNGYLGYELCHPLPVVEGKVVGLEYVDRNAKLAAKYLKQTVAAAKSKS